MAVLAPARWWRLTPILFITYSIAYLDRVNFSFAAAGGIATDLALPASTSSLIGALFFLGYFAGQVPGAWLAERQRPRRVIFWCLLLWGACSTLTGLVSNVAALMTVRFLLGLVEAAVFPALVMFVGSWFARSERSLANSFITLSTPVTVLWMSILSGYLVRALGWRWMFVLEGLPALAWAVGWWLLADDGPAQAAWLAPADRLAIEQRISSEQGGLAPMRSYADAFQTPVVIRMALLYFFWGMSLFGLVLWLPTILREGGRDIVTTGWLSAGPYLCAALVMPLVSWLADRARDRRRIVWPCLAISGAAFLALYPLRGGSFVFTYVALVVAGVGPIVAIAPFFAIPADILPKNVTGGAVALINSLGALGGFLGTYLVGWSTGLTHDPAVSFLLMGCSLIIAAVLLVIPSAGFAAPARARMS